MKKKLLCAFLICTISVLTACGSSNDSSKAEYAETSSEDSNMDASVENDTEEDDTENAGAEAVLCNQDNIEITAQLTKPLESDWQLDLAIDNQSDKNISVGIIELKTNDILAGGCEMNSALNPVGQPDLQLMLEAGFTITEVAAGDAQTAEDVTYALGERYLEESGITTLEKLNLTLGIFNTDTQELLFQTESVEMGGQ